MSTAMRIENHSQEPIDESLLRRAVLAVVEGEGMDLVPTLIVVDDDEMTRLHDQFMNLKSTTDSMAFPADDGDGSLGDVFANAALAAREAPEHGMTAQSELCLYAIHGTLHLCGYEDKSDTGQADMRRLESKYLAEVGF